MLSLVCGRMFSGHLLAVLLSYASYQTLVVALALSRLDYGNATLAGLPTYLLDRLQSVMNAAARSTACLRRSDHITDTLAIVFTGYEHLSESRSSLL